METKPSMNRRWSNRMQVTQSLLHQWCGRRRAMTLLELLMVMAVSAVLVGVLLPALRGAREEGRSARCAATLHDAGLAMTMYLDANEGAFWPYFMDLPGPDGGRRWWFGLEHGGASSSPTRTNRPLDKSAGFLGPYLGASADDLLCPSFPYAQPKYFPKFSPSAGGYGYNTAALGGSSELNPLDRRSRRIQEFDGETSDVFALADGIHFDRLDYSSAAPLEQSFNEPPYLQWQDPSLFGSNVGVNGGYGHFRHSGRANVLFLDSHVAGQPPRGRLHPYTEKGYGPVANLSDELQRTREIKQGRRTLNVDVIYGLR